MSVRVQVIIEEGEAARFKSQAHGIITNDNDFLRLKDCLEIWLFDPDQGI
jgi:hypothetical protein